MKTRAIRGGKRRRRGGFSLTEVLVAMTLLSIILMGLARVTFQMAAASRRNDTVAKRNAVLVQEANKFNAIPFSTLLAYNNTSRVFTFGDFKFTRRVTVTSTTASSTTRYTVKIVITPFLEPTKVDSVFVFRVNPPGSPLCTTC